MQNVSVAERPLLMGDHVADLLLVYAAVLGATTSADTVKVRVVGHDGAHRTAQLLLNGASRLLSETSSSQVPEPDNAALEAYLQQRIDSHRLPHDVLAGLHTDVDEAGTDGTEA